MGVTNRRQSGQRLPGLCRNQRRRG